MSRFCADLNARTARTASAGHIGSRAPARRAPVWAGGYACADGKARMCAPDVHLAACRTRRVHARTLICALRMLCRGRHDTTVHRTGGDMRVEYCASGRCCVDVCGTEFETHAHSVPALGSRELVLCLYSPGNSLAGAFIGVATHHWRWAAAQTRVWRTTFFFSRNVCLLLHQRDLWFGFLSYVC
jgi:hypothetical protein